MEKLILCISTKSSNIDKAISELVNAGFPIQTMSIIMKESDDVAQSYTQRLTMIDTIIGKRIGMKPITILGIENVVVGGPLTALLGITSLDETYNPEDIVIDAVAGGFINACMTIGINEEEAYLYEASILKGELLFGIDVSEANEAKALQTLEAHHVDHIVRISAK